jgi:hypothetical protein
MDNGGCSAKNAVRRSGRVDTPAHLVGVAVSSPMAAAPATGTRANAVGKAA